MSHLYPGMDFMRILVVEDDVQLADVITEALCSHQYIVDTVQDGEMASDWLEALPYD